MSWLMDGEDARILVALMIVFGYYLTIGTEDVRGSR